MTGERWKCGRCRVEFDARTCTYQVTGPDGRTKIIVCGSCYGSRSAAA